MAFVSGTGGASVGSADGQRRLVGRPSRRSAGLATFSGALWEDSLRSQWLGEGWLGGRHSAGLGSAGTMRSLSSEAKRTNSRQRITLSISAVVRDSGATSQTRAVWSALAVTMRLPSGLYAAVWTPF